jgi:hypothetical protein
VMKEYENRFGKLPVEAGDQPQPGAQV